MSFLNFGGGFKKKVVTHSHQESYTTTTSSSSGPITTSYQTSFQDTHFSDGKIYRDEGPKPNFMNSITSKSNKKQITKPDIPKTKTSGGSTKPEKDFHELCLKTHNSYRAKHGVPALKLNKKLSEFSQEWANKLAKSGRMEHRTNSDYGENLYFKWSSSPINLGGDEAVNAWYDEIKDYQYGSDRSVSKTGHFTQVVWRESTELGVGMARNAKGEIFVVCNYNPPGNFIGKFKENVLPPKK